MLKYEKNYDFRKRLLEIHKKDVRDYDVKTPENAFELSEGISIYVPDKSDVILTAARDLVDYLFISMNVSAIVKVGDGKNDINPKVVLNIAENVGWDLGDAKGYRGFDIKTTNEGIFVYGNDDRGVAQAIYYIEDLMTLNRAPYIEIGAIRKKPMYGPQMIHSGYGLDEFPNEYLSAVAHAGRDAILVFTKDVHITPYGYLDFNELIYRAAKYGIDVYAYSYLKSNMHPDSPGAEAYYEANYGKLFRECPGLKGVTLVGESVEFPSNDPNVFKGRYFENSDNGIPTGKPSPGWYPCEDYPLWLNLLKKVIRKYKSDADIVFWTYNWGYHPEDIRIKLIESLPTDISLQATFEMFGKSRLGNSERESADYSLAPAGYGGYFKSEAEAAKKRGIRLYSMTNTGGLTWDIGVIPYEPFPHQWIKRYKAMEEAREKWGLCGLMECHHYGMYPSFISKLSKWVFMEDKPDYDKILADVLKSEFGKENVETVNEALKLWSEAISYYTPTNSDQYGAFRVGPAYPMYIEEKVKIPDVPYSMFGNRICQVDYVTFCEGRNAPVGVRIYDEIDSLKKMRDCMEKGLEIIKKVESPNDEVLYLINLGEFILCTVITGIHAKQWHLYKTALVSEREKKKQIEVLEGMRELMLAERENVKNAIPLVQVDSRLGWEPSMEYMCDEYHLNWKLKQVNFVLDYEIPTYEKAIAKVKYED